MSPCGRHPGPLGFRAKRSLSPPQGSRPPGGLSLYRTESTAPRTVGPGRHSGGDPMHSGRAHHARVSQPPTQREAMSLAGFRRRLPWGSPWSARSPRRSRRSRSRLPQPRRPGPCGRLGQRQPARTSRGRPSRQLKAATGREARDRQLRAMEPRPRRLPPRKPPSDARR
jgi:hypothetical protein